MYEYVWISFWVWTIYGVCAVLGKLVYGMLITIPKIELVKWIIEGWG